MAAVGGDETATLSPKNRVKLLCSHGGKILPRPPDGQLKYVGGENRVIVVPRDINFSELMKKLGSLVNGEMVLKYQLVPEDMDALVSVRSDEDVNHMLDEYDRYEAKSSESGGSPRLRAFLFPSNLNPFMNQMAVNTVNSHALEQRYIDAINGVVRTPHYLTRTYSNISRPTLSFSTGSSPRSIIPDGYTMDGINSNGYNNGGIHQMQRVKSSPSLSSLAHHNHPSHQHQQLSPPLYQSSLRAHCLHTCGRPAPALAIGRSDFGRSQMGHSHSQYYSPTRQPVGSWGCAGCRHVDECGVYRCEVEKADNLPPSPMKQTWEQGESTWNHGSKVHQWVGRSG